MKHAYEVVEVPGHPDSVRAICLCGWEGPAREIGPRNQCDEDGSDHVEDIQPKRLWCPGGMSWKSHAFRLCDC